MVGDGCDGGIMVKTHPPVSSVQQSLVVWPSMLPPDPAL